MKKTLCVKPRVNKKNGQINISLPRKQLSKKFSQEIMEMKSLKVILEDWE